MAKTNARKKSTVKFKSFKNNSRALLFVPVFAIIGIVVLRTSFAARGSATFAWNTYNVSINAPVEQWVEWPFPSRDKWVVNSAVNVSPPGPCAWDVDDHWYLLASGPISPGETVNADQCRVADPNPIQQIRNGTTGWWNQSQRYTGVRIQSPSPDLKVTLSYAPQGRTFTVSPLYDTATKQYIYRGCVGLSYKPNDPDWQYEKDPAVQPIAGSNGGWGVITHGTVAVTNPTTRRINATGKIEELAAWTLDSTADSFCGVNRSDYGSWQHEYPFTFHIN